MKKSTKVILGAIFLITLALRLYFAFQTPNFSSDEAYFNIRNAEYIDSNIKPIIFDELSYGGRYVLDPHVFHYLLALFNLVLPGMIAFKLLPEIIFAALIFFVFAIAKEVTGNETAAIFSALIMAFTPVFYKATLNQVSIYSIAFFMLLFMIYSFFDLRRNVYRFVILSLLLPLVHTIGFFFAASMLVYLLLAGLESIRVEEISKESIVLVLFFNVLVAFLLFKNAFLTTGMGAIWQNVPAGLLDSYFKNINVLEIITEIGIIPITFGTVGFLFALKAKKKSIYALSAFVLTDFVLLALKMINFSTGLMILGLLLAIISAIALDKLIDYVNMTKFARYKRLATASFLVLILLTLALPSVSVANQTIKSTINEKEVEALNWINLNTPEQSTVLAGINEGNYVTAIAKRKNVADTLFLLAPDRYADMEELFRTQSLVKAIDLIKKYKIGYIYLSERTKSSYNIKELVYARDENCFQKVFYAREAEVYRVLC